MTQNEILVAMLQIALTEAKETAGCLEFSKNCGLQVLEITTALDKALFSLKRYEEKQKKKA